MVRSQTDQLRCECKVKVTQASDDETLGLVRKAIIMAWRNTNTNVNTHHSTYDALKELKW